MTSEAAAEIGLALTPYLVGALIAVVAWIGRRLHDKLDRIEDTMATNREAVSTKLAAIESEIRHFDNRIRNLEAALHR